MRFGVIIAPSSETTFKQIREATCQFQMCSLLLWHEFTTHH